MGKIQKHHVKHAGFFLAVSVLIFNLVFATLVVQDTIAAKGGMPVQINFSVSGAGAKTHYDSSGWPADATCPGDQCFYLTHVNASSSSQTLPTIKAMLDSGKVVKSWSITQKYGEKNKPLVCKEGVSANTCTIVLPAYELSDYYLYNLVLTVTDKPKPEPPKPKTTTQPTIQQSTVASADKPESEPETKELEISEVSLNGNKLASSVTEDDTPIFKSDEKLTISGKTEPNGKVKIYIFSDPQTVEVTADTKGIWTYEVTNIGSGDHHIEVAVINKDGKEGKRQKLGGFKVLAAETTPVNTAALTPIATQEATSKTPLIVTGVVSLLAIVYIVWYWLHHKHSILNHHKKAHGDTSDSSMKPPSQHAE